MTTLKALKTASKCILHKKLFSVTDEVLFKARGLNSEGGTFNKMQHPTKFNTNLLA
jgi:hypothetical protein